MKPHNITPDITIRLLPQQQIPASAVNCYGLAGKIVISDTAWPELEPFRIGSPGEWEGDELPELQEFGPPTGEADRSVEGWVAEKDRMVSCRDAEEDCRVEISSIGEFFVSTACDLITALSPYRLCCRDDYTQAMHARSITHQRLTRLFLRI